MRIVLVEDDALQAREIRDFLAKNLPETSVDWLPSESAFYDALRQYESQPPDLFILDVILRWATVEEVMPPVPEEVAEEGRYEAGLRCVRKLCNLTALSRVPVIIYTVQDPPRVATTLAGLPPHILYLHKSPDIGELLIHVRSLLESIPGAVVSNTPSWRKTLGEAVEVKPGWLGVSVDLKAILRRLFHRPRSE